jgi:hypothetical protein
LERDIKACFVHFRKGHLRCRLDLRRIRPGGPSTAPLSYIADPKVFKLLSENDQFRVIEAKRLDEYTDAWHSYSPVAVYNLSDCQTRLHQPDGKITGGTAPAKAGTVVFNPVNPSHAAENTGTAECHRLLVENNAVSRRGEGPFGCNRQGGEFGFSIEAYL